ncbi:zinc finger, CCHC-type containing protein, partial [Tanacetum coccineum]
VRKTINQHTSPNPQPQALGTTFEARVRDYMAAHTERIQRFKNAIFKQREEINDKMTKIFGLLKELTTSRAPKKVLIREEAKFLITKNVNSISLTRGEEERSKKTDITTGDDIEKPTKTNGNDRIAEDVLVGVAEHVYLVDFVILDIKEDEKRPFILGTPFLTTTKSIIKFDKGTITLSSGKSKISFHRIPESLCKIEKGVKNDIEPITPTMTVNRMVMEWEERIKLHLEREMEFDQ